MQPALSLEQEVAVAEAKWPRSGKLLSRQNHVSDTFYRDFAFVNRQFAAALHGHLRTKGNLIALVRELEELQGHKAGGGALQSYAKSRTNRLPLQTYNALSSLLNGKCGTSLEQKALPDACSGFYIGMLLAWYFDAVDKRTKGLENPMPSAVEMLLPELAQADEEIAAMLRGTKEERNAAECRARDILTGRGGLIRFPVFSRYEAAVIASLDIYSNDTTPEQLRRAFERADRRVLAINGHKVTANLEASLKAQLKALIFKQYQYDAETTYTPPGIDYFVGDRITHPTRGDGIVVAVETADVLTKDRNPYREPEYQAVVKFDSGNIVPLIVRKQPPAFNPHFA